jgi:hypothetical protein
MAAAARRAVFLHAGTARNHAGTSTFIRVIKCGRSVGVRGILLWLLGIPIPVIILLYLFHVI